MIINCTVHFGWEPPAAMSLRYADISLPDLLSVWVLAMQTELLLYNKPPLFRNSFIKIPEARRVVLHSKSERVQYSLLMIITSKYHFFLTISINVKNIIIKTNIISIIFRIVLVIIILCNISFLVFFSWVSTYYVSFS